MKNLTSNQLFAMFGQFNKADAYCIKVLSAVCYCVSFLIFIQVLGFDCEWVNSNGFSHPVSLVQFASVSGTCVLVQLQILALSGIPKTLRSLLSDKRFIVAC